MAGRVIELSEAFAKAMGLKNEPGWTGAFTRQQQALAIPNGTRIVKIFKEPGDIHGLGAQGTILGSILHPALGIGYYVEWDASPKCAVLVIENKIAVL